MGVCQYDLFASTNFIRELPPSVATAIAEGKLNPMNMEAFDYFPSSECHLGLIVMQNPRKPEFTVVSREKTCFLELSSHITGEKDIAGKLFNPSTHGLLQTDANY